MSTPARADTRYLSLDHWRGFASFWVVIYHAILAKPIEGQIGTHTVPGLIGKFIDRGWLGVPIFFVISGYCIAVAAESNIEKGYGLVTFFTRRQRRIYPPFWASLFFAVAVCALFNFFGHRELVETGPNSKLISATSTDAWQWFGNLTLTEGWRPRLFGSPERFLIGTEWSLVYEEQYYALCGLLILLAPKHLFKGIVLVTVVSLLFLPYGLTYGPKGVDPTGFFVDHYWVLFAAGVLVHVYLNRADASLKRWLGAALVGGLLTIVAVDYGHVMRLDSHDKTFLAHLVVGLAFAILLLVLHPYDKRLAGNRWLRPLQWLGGISYSLYIVHFPITTVVSNFFATRWETSLNFQLLVVIPLSAAASIAFAWAFNHFIERRFLNSALVAKAVSSDSRGLTVEQATPVASAAVAKST